MELICGILAYDDQLMDEVSWLCNPAWSDGSDQDWCRLVQRLVVVGRRLQQVNRTPFKPTHHQSEEQHCQTRDVCWRSGSAHYSLFDGGIWPSLQQRYSCSWSDYGAPCAVVPTAEVPVVATAEVPVVQSETLLVAQGETVPEVQSEAVPAVQSEVVPTVQSEAVPVVQKMAIPESACRWDVACWASWMQLNSAATLQKQQPVSSINGILGRAAGVDELRAAWRGGARRTDGCPARRRLLRAVDCRGVVRLWGGGGRDVTYADVLRSPIRPSGPMLHRQSVSDADIGRQRRDELAFRRFLRALGVSRPDAGLRELWRLGQPSAAAGLAGLSGADAVRRRARSLDSTAVWAAAPETTSSPQTVTESRGSQTTDKRTGTAATGTAKKRRNKKKCREQQPTEISQSASSWQCSTRVPPPPRAAGFPTTIPPTAPCSGAAGRLLLPYRRPGVVPAIQQSAGVFSAAQPTAWMQTGSGGQTCSRYPGNCTGQPWYPDTSTRPPPAGQRSVAASYSGATVSTAAGKWYADKNTQPAGNPASSWFTRQHSQQADASCNLQ